LNLSSVFFHFVIPIIRFSYSNVFSSSKLSVLINFASIMSDAIAFNQINFNDI